MMMENVFHSFESKILKKKEKRKKKRQALEKKIYYKLKYN